MERRTPEMLCILVTALAADVARGDADLAPSICYNEFHNSNAENGYPDSGAKTLADCLRPCNILPTCSAIDYDSVYNGCWRHSGDLVVKVNQAPGVTHYKKVPCFGRSTLFSTPSPQTANQSQVQSNFPSIIGGSAAAGVALIIIISVFIFVCIRRRRQRNTSAVHGEEMRPIPRPMTSQELPDVATSHFYEDLVMADAAQTVQSQRCQEGQVEFNKWLQENDFNMATKDKMQQHGVMTLKDVKRLSPEDMIEIGFNVGERNRIKDAVLSMSQSFIPVYIDSSYLHTSS